MQASDRTGLRVLGKFWSSDTPGVRPWMGVRDVMDSLSGLWQPKSTTRRITSLQACGMLESSTGKLEHWEDQPHTRGVQWRITDSGIELLSESQPDVRLRWIEDERTKE